MCRNIGTFEIFEGHSVRRLVGAPRLGVASQPLNPLPVPEDVVDAIECPVVLIGKSLKGSVLRPAIHGVQELVDVAAVLLETPLEPGQPLVVQQGPLMPALRLPVGERS